MLLFFDTESTGIPKNYKAPVSDVDNWPRLVQLGYIITDNGKIIHQNEDIVEPDGFEIPVEASDIHGITTELAKLNGIDIVEVLDEFQFWVEQCDTVIGHNVPSTRTLLAQNTTDCTGKARWKARNRSVRCFQE